MKEVVLVSSCDAYSDCWSVMTHSFRKFWPDCPYPIYFISNFKSIDEDGIHFIKVGEDRGFCSNLKQALESINAERIIFFLDDYFINKKIDSDVIKRHIIHCENNNVDFLKIDSWDIIFRDELRIGKSIYCNNPINIKYALNTAIAIWRKDKLLSLCVDGYTAWDFEKKGIVYSTEHPINLVSETILSWEFDGYTIRKIGGAGAIRKGKWTNEGVNFLIENGFNHLISNRKKEGRFSNYLISFYKPNSITWVPIGILLRIIQRFKISI